jgi:ABC-2 type transport system ATP-binding protein
MNAPAIAQSTAETHAVSVTGLQRRFGRFVAVAGIDFEVHRGEIFGFLGPNGAGKSTTIRMLCGILTPSGGSGHVAGFDIRTQAEAIKASIGYMSQRFSLYEDLTVEENIDFFSGVYRIADAKKRERKEWVIESAGLTHHRRTRTALLSGGWKQRLALGCAILHEPPIVFLDEPTSGVDPISRRNFWEVIHALADAGTTVFVTTHYMDEAEYCDRVALIYRGELIACGSPTSLKRDHDEQIIEVVCDRPSEAMDILESCVGVRDAALFGGAVHVVIDDAAQRRDTLANALRSADLTVKRIDRITPTLEDVFVSRIEARDRRDGALTQVQQ